MLEQLFGVGVVIPDAIDRGMLASARARLADFSRYALLDRGSYEVSHVDVGLSDAIRTIAQRTTNRELAIAEMRVLRLGPGDYLLAHHDRLHDDNPVEVMLDLSAASVPDAEVHYRRRGQVFLHVPCVPGSVAVVERGPTVTCNHTYISKLHPNAAVVRLVALLR
jgi:hypothetical protein